jgi:hypothetical protein
MLEVRMQLDKSPANDTDQHNTASDVASHTHMALVHRTSDMLYVYLCVYFLGMFGATDTKLGGQGKSEWRSR